MKILNRVVLVMMFSIVLYVPVSYATGPGFDNDVNNWSYDNNDHGDDDWNDDDCNQNEIPLDGGLSILAAAGAAYGVKRVRDRKGQKNSEK